MTELAKGYDPRAIEDAWYQRWLDARCFEADPESGKPPWVIVIPPPNVTGSLHMGHAMYTIQDILIRTRRMQGFEALWLPGTDHAGIATQTVVERQLRARGITRQDLGREAFLDEVWKWKEQSGDRIFLQFRRLGYSLDWSRQRFTMDADLSRAVREAFVRMYEDGLLYQDDRLVNWDPGTRTVLSDLEVEQEEEDGMLWHIAYPVTGSDERLIVATTRPETLLGDTAVAIHPDDPRYLHLHGRTVDLPLTGRSIPILCDPVAVDMTFGSGAVKITPAHDFNDFETGRRNGLDSICVLDLDARINDNAPEAYRGLTREDARKRILEDLRDRGLLVKESPHRFMPGRSQRSGLIVEPMSVGRQWYVRMEPLAKPAIVAVRDGRIRMVPSNWDRTYYHWMENIRDWCISRQLWWGHRIPAWTCGACGHLAVLREDPSACPSCGSTDLHQDEDVLDTWFSSGLWPFSTMGWPDRTRDLERFYPGTVLETGFDILFFWVARMIMMGMHLMGDVPFRTVLLHALVRDRFGNKMSKTRGNVIDPLHVVDGVDPSTLDAEERKACEQLLQAFPEGLPPQGADALRFTLATYATAGRDIRLDVKRVEGYRTFMNKLWNATRFAMMHLGEFDPSAPAPAADALSLADRWILVRWSAVCAQATQALEEYRIGDAAHALYEFVWHQLCDWYLELLKPVMHGDDAPAREAARHTLHRVLDGTLRLLHPFVPFITEELWAALPRRADESSTLLCTAAWPAPVPEAAHWEQDARDMELVIATVQGVRRIRGESEIPPGKPLPRVLVLSDDASTRAVLQAQAPSIRTLARIETLEVAPADTLRPDRAATTMEGAVEIVVSLEGLVDVAAEEARMRKELEKVQADIAFFEKKLGNADYVQRAPAAVVEKDRARLAEVQAAARTLQEALERLLA
jgi:valyl-tRNA synthetase